MLKNFKQADEEGYLWEHNDTLFLFKKPNNQGIILEGDDLHFAFSKTEKELLADYDISYIAFEWGGVWYKTKYAGDEYLVAKFDPIRYTDTKKKRAYTHLGFHSIYELLNGTGSFDHYLEKAKYFKMEAMGICDKNTLSGTLPFQLACQKKGIQPILGVTYNLTYKIGESEYDYDVKVYVENEVGWRNLLRLHKIKNIDNDGRLDADRAYEHSQGLIFVLSSFSYLTDEKISRLEALKLAVKDKTKFKGNIFQQIDPVEYSSPDSDNKHLLGLKRYFNHFSKQIEPVLLQDSYYVDKSQAKYKLWTNGIGKQSFQHSEDQYFKHFDTLIGQIVGFFSDEEETFLNGVSQDKIFMLMSVNNKSIADRCKFTINTGQSKIPKYFDHEGRDTVELYHSVIKRNFKRLVPKGKEEEYQARLEKENYIIVEAELIDYFLILYDVIEFCKREGIRYGMGRGSVGGSLVAYLLGIIDIDPIKHDLLFERFLNETRTLPEKFIEFEDKAGNKIEVPHEKEIDGKKAFEFEVGDMVEIDGKMIKIKHKNLIKRRRPDIPDIDLDFMASRRDEVKKYLIRRWGADQVTYIGSFTTMKLKGGLKDYGNVRGKTFQQINYVTGMIPNKLKYDWEDIFKFAQTKEPLKDFIQKNPDIINCIKYTMKQPKAMSVHASAIVVTPTHDEQGNRMQVWDWMPVRKLYDKDTGKYVIVSEWEGSMMDVCGFLKEDILGLKQLDEYSNSINLIKKFYGDELDLLKIPLDDEPTYDLFQRGICEGVFQFHTSGMKSYCKFVLPDCIEDLIAMNALFRPGPMSSNAHSDFALIKHGKKKPEYDEFMYEVTKNTQGLYVYQEQIMQAMVVAGMSLVESDSARVAVKKFKKEVMDGFKNKFVEGYSKLLAKKTKKRSK